ncbi:MAG: hypothetical protein WCD70_12635 [Alphaproteobacteria bacterium]
MKQNTPDPQKLFLELTGFEWNESASVRASLYALHFQTASSPTSANMIGYVDHVLKLAAIEPDIDQKEKLLGSLEVEVSSYQNKQAPIYGPLYKIGPIYERLIEAIADHTFSDCRHMLVKTGLVWASNEKHLSPPQNESPETAACPVANFFNNAVNYYHWAHTYDQLSATSFEFPLSLMNNIVFRHHHLASQNFLEMCLDFADTPVPERKHFQPHQKSEAEKEREDIRGVARLEHKALEILGKWGTPHRDFDLPLNPRPPSPG